MQRLGEFWRRLVFLVRQRQLDRDLEEEMRDHLERKAERNRAAGMPADEAGYAARRQFGNATLLKETSRDAWGWGPLERLAQDIRHSVRTLRNNPGFTAVAVLTLASGIGANTAVFSVVNAVLFRPLPFRDPGRLAMIWEKWHKRGEERVVVSPLQFNAWKEQSRSFERMAAIRFYGAIATLAEEPVEISAMQVSGEFFDVLGVKPAFGRTFSREEQSDAGARVAMIGHGLWLRLGGDPRLVGKTVQLNREPYTVVGIMPRGFDFPYESEVWFTLPPGEMARQETTHFLRVVGKLKPDASFAQVRSELDTIATRLRQAYPQHNPVIGVSVVPLHEQIVGERRRALLVLLGVVACVLLIACANVANLLMARATGRRREIALRLALGASRWRVVRYLLTESVLLALAGGAVGLAAAWCAVRVFVAYDPIKLPRVQEIAIDGSVLLFAFVVAVSTGILFGLIPALRLSRPDLNQTLKDGASSHTAGERNRGRSALAVAQVALAIVLLIGAGLFLRSFLRRISVPLGFRPDGVLAVELPWSVNRRLDPLLERLGALPGVVRAGAGTAFPNNAAGTSCSIGIEGQPKASGQELMAGRITVTPDYYAAAGMELRKGRFTAAADTANAPLVAVINEALARRYPLGQDPIGRHLKACDGRFVTIVGVTGNVKGFGVDGDPMPTFYLPYQQGSWNNPVHVLLRTAVPPASLAGTVRKEIRARNKGIIIGKLVPIEDLLSESVAVPRFYMLLVVAFGALAATLAAVGVYGVISYSAAQRTHEIGVRMALGAERRDVLRMILRQGLALILAGVALGLACAWASTHVLASLLFQVQPGDALSFTGAAVLLIAAGLAACYIPARRATKIDPMRALRYE